MKNQYKELDSLIENLLLCTYSDNYRERAAAYTALGNFIDRDDITWRLYEGLNDIHPEVKEAAKSSLKSLYNKSNEEEFLKKLTKEKEAIKKIS